MRKRLLELIVCPRCHENLVLDARELEGEEVMAGRLGCVGCDASYPVEGGIPRLLPEVDEVPRETQITVDRFGDQWNDFDFMGEHYEKQFLGWIAPNTPATFEGKVVLEAGCGKGRHSALVSRFGAKDVIAVDLGSAVAAAFRNTRQFENVHIVQADLFHLPIANQSVDVTFSVGVLHHTPDPRGCFLELVKTIRPGGRVIAWVYGRENNGWIIHGINPLRRRITSRLPHRWVYQLSKVPAALLFGVGRGIYHPMNRGAFEPLGRRLFYQAYVNHISNFPFAEVHSIVHDHLTPLIAHYIEGDAFRAWFQDAKLEDVTIGWHNENSWRGTGISPIADQRSMRAASAS